MTTKQLAQRVARLEVRVQPVTIVVAYVDKTTGAVVSRSPARSLEDWRNGPPWRVEADAGD